MEVQVVVRFFAGARDRAGIESTKVKLPSKWETGDALLDELVERFSSLSELRPVLALALNEEYVMNERIQLCEADVLALIPPISGG